MSVQYEYKQVQIILFMSDANSNVTTLPYARQVVHCQTNSNLGLYSIVLFYSGSLQNSLLVYWSNCIHGFSSQLFVAPGSLASVFKTSGRRIASGMETKARPINTSGCPCRRPCNSRAANGHGQDRSRWESEESPT